MILIINITAHSANPHKFTNCINFFCIEMYSLNIHYADSLSIDLIVHSQSVAHEWTSAFTWEIVIKHFVIFTSIISLCLPCTLMINMLVLSVHPGCMCTVLIIKLTSYIKLKLYCKICRDREFKNPVKLTSLSNLSNSAVAYPGGFSGCPETPPPGHDFCNLPS